MRGFIYKITNKVNGKSYIGLTILDVKERFYQHCATKCSQQVLDMAIHKAIAKYGKKNFTLKVIELTEDNLLNEREIYWIQYYDSYKNGYNSTVGGQGGNKAFKELDTQLIIDSYLSGKSLRYIGTLVNVDKQTIKDLLIRNNIKLRTTRTYKLSQEDRLTIINEIKSGSTRQEVMNKWNISKSYLSLLINGYRRI